MHIGIDIGGTWIKVAWRHAPDDRTATATVSSDVLRHSQGWFERMAGALPTNARKALDSGKLAGVGIGVAGEIHDPGVVFRSPNFPHWGNKVPIGPDLSTRLGVPVWVENDANMAAVALTRHARHAGGELDNVCVVTLGTGIGSGWLLEGRLFRRPAGGEFELGHCPVVAGGERCSCGNQGCVEAYAGGWAMLAQYAKRTGVRLDSVETLVARVKAGDEDAELVFQIAGNALGQACAWVTNMVTTRRFVFVGGASNARALLLPSLKRAYRRQAFPTYARKATFRFPPKRSFWGVEGALVAAESNGQYRLRIPADPVPQPQAAR